MYRYDQLDRDFVMQRVEQFRRQVGRRLTGELSEDEFKPLRLMNGLYLQLHAYMLRVAIPYGALSSDQMRRLAHIARRYDKGYGHLTTRQNIQYNWPKLIETPDILAELAEVEMHALQTSGNCIRNVTADQYAGAAADEVDDPRIYAEIVRQWSSCHPEFSFLPRKFKIAITGASEDRAAVKVHDIGLRMHRNAEGDIGFEVFVGGGLGRNPYIGKSIRDFVAVPDLLGYLEAILRVYNQLGRRDNLYKARIKVTVHETGTDRFRELVEEEFSHLEGGDLTLPEAEVERMRAYFLPPDFEVLDDECPELEAKRSENPAFDAWVRNSIDHHKQPGYAIVNVSVKPIGGVPGDISADQMDAFADLAEELGHDDIRVTHRQNLVLPHVRKRDLYAVWERLSAERLATPNIGLASDIICCPGLDYCALANARSIPVAQRISERLADLERQKDIGDLEIKMSGCMNACGHHHVGHIGILGVEKKNKEFYQITLGGSADEDAAIGKIVGRGFAANEIVDAIDTLVDAYLELRTEGERFLDTYHRVGAGPFKERLYAGD